MFKVNAKRTNVTVDDRRAVLMLAKSRKDRDVTDVPHEAFLVNALKERMGFASKDEPTESMLAAAKQLAAILPQPVKVVVINVQEKAENQKLTA